MPRRSYDLRRHCDHPDCKEWTVYNYDTKADYHDAIKRYHGTKWLCTRHSSPDRLLTPENIRTQISYVCTEKDGNKYWKQPDKAHLSSGFISGNGWKAFAKDFPVGTVLSEASAITLPDNSFLD